MRECTAPFPYIDSFALYDDFLWRVFRHNADGTVTICRDGTGGSFHRNVDPRDLIDPSNIVAMSPDKQTGLALASALRDADILLAADIVPLRDDLLAAGRIKWRPTVAQIESLLGKLGWHRTLLNGRRAWHRTADREVSAAQVSA